ncbi:cytochrome P450 [Trichoderma novae-zelandiae]
MEKPGDVVVSYLSPSWQLAAGVALLAGIASHHLVFRPYEIDTYAWQLVFIYTTAVATVFASHVHIGGYASTSALLQTLFFAHVYNCSVVVSILVYRAFFHPLRKFPGPFLARFSRLYAMSKMVQSRKGYEDVQKLHLEYGDIVRVGPRELSINRPSAIRAIYGAHTQTTRPPWYSQISRHAEKSSLVNTRDVVMHKQRKKVWERALGSRALEVYEPRVRAKTELLLSKIDAAEGNPIDVTKYFMYFSFDVMADVGFSKDFHMLESTSYHPAIKGVHKTMSFIGVLSTVPWLIYMIGSIPGLTTFNRFSMWCHDEVSEKRKVLAVGKEKEPQDVMSWLLKAMDDNDPSAPPGEQAVQEDARLLIIAGSDTSAGVLANAFYLLAGNPRCYQQLQTEVQKQFPGGLSEWTYEEAKAIPYMDNVIHETLRLRPTVPGGMPRNIPPQGLSIDGQLIPGGTIAAVPTYTIQRDGRYWADPLAFRPERWEGCATTDGGVAWMAFSRGPWACPGRSLAMMEMRMVLSRVALQFDVGFALGKGGEGFERDTVDNVSMTLPELNLVFTPRTGR